MHLQLTNSITNTKFVITTTKLDTLNFIQVFLLIDLYICIILFFELLFMMPL